MCIAIGERQVVGRGDIADRAAGEGEIKFAAIGIGDVAEFPGAGVAQGLAVAVAPGDGVEATLAAGYGIGLGGVVGILQRIGGAAAGQAVIRV
ncbi:hypothetical protein D3C85_1403670 [compost metagenome]